MTIKITITKDTVRQGLRIGLEEGHIKRLKDNMANMYIVKHLWHDNSTGDNYATILEGFEVPVTGSILRIEQ